MDKVRVPSLVDRQFKKVRESGRVLMSDAIGVAIEADRRGFDELADFIASNRNHYHKVVVGQYVISDRVCQCIEEETGVDAALWADAKVEPIDAIRSRWERGPKQGGVRFEDFAREWFEAAQEYRMTSPNAYKPDPDCPYCGGSGITDVEECQEYSNP
jgi:hypothetical protein